MQNKRLSRKKFLFWGISLAALAELPFVVMPHKRKKVPKAVKMLTQDGGLVEVDACRIPEKKRKIKNIELLTWIKNKNASL